MILKLIRDLKQLQEDKVEELQNDKTKENQSMSKKINLRTDEDKIGTQGKKTYWQKRST